MLLSGAESIREVILFPTLRPEFSLPPELTPTPRGPVQGSSRDGAGQPAQPTQPGQLGAEGRTATVTALSSVPSASAGTPRPTSPGLSLIHISEPTRRTPISY